MDADARSLVTGKVCPTCQTTYGPDIERCPQDNSLLAVVRRDPFIGKVIGDKYQIIEVLGTGGFSTVYRAEQSSLKRSVAVKILHAEFVDKPDKIRRFQNEAESISTLVHTNVASVYDYGVLSEGQPYLIMEYASGQTLADILDETPRLDSERAVDIFLQTCEGIAAAHAKGLIHRDIKPSNIVLTKADDGSERIKILDFGLAKVVADTDGQRENLTMTGEVLGTPAYMSPEQCMGTATDVRTDIYSFGIVMYEILSGKLPLVGDNSYEVMNKHIHETPVLLSKNESSIPPRLVRIVTKALQKDPDDRYQTIEELKDALSGVEPRISEELKSIIFSGGSKKLSKKKQALKRKVMLSVWAVALASIGFISLLTIEYFGTQHKQKVAEEYANKTFVFDCGPVRLEYPAIYEMQVNKNDTRSVMQFANRIGKLEFFELKELHEGGDAAEVAASQREQHKAYNHFFEVKPIDELDFGKDKKLHGYSTEFIYEAAFGLTRERHVYWGGRNNVWKFKTSTLVTKDEKIDALHSIILDTIEFRPGAELRIPPLK